MQTSDRKVFIHNIVVNLLDGGFFGFGLGLASFSTVLPLFVSTMTNSALLIGLIPAIHNVGWQLPQLFTAKRISRMDRIKPYVILMTGNERLPFLGFAIVGLLIPSIGAKAGLVITFLLLVWQGMGAGLTANAWQILISKVIPSENLATFFGAQSAAANLLASAGALLAGILLVKIPPPYNFPVCFFAAALFFLISWFSLAQTKEKTRIAHAITETPQPFWKNIGRILKEDKVFRSFLVSRFLSQFGMMAFAFYTVYAVKKLGMDTLTVGIMTSILLITQTVANPLLGWLADRFSRKWILVLGGLCAVLSAVLAIFIHNIAWFAVVFILYGIANTAYWTIGMTIALEFGDEVERPVYVGMANTLIAPSTILAPVLGGLLADLFSYTTTFYVSAVFGVITLFLLVLFVNDPKKRSLEVE